MADAEAEQGLPAQELAGADVIKLLAELNVTERLLALELLGAETTADDEPDAAVEDGTTVAEELAGDAEDVVAPAEDEGVADAELVAEYEAAHEQRAAASDSTSRPVATPQLLRTQFWAKD